MFLPSPSQFLLSSSKKKKSNNIRTERVQDAILLCPKPPQDSSRKHWLLRLCKSTSLAVYLTWNLTAQMYKLSPFFLFQNLPSDVYKAQNTEGNSRQTEFPFKSLGSVDLTHQWIEFLKIFWINSITKEGCDSKLYCWLLFIKTLSSPVKNLNTTSSLHFKWTSIRF